jgi:hypothetical protein
LGTSLIASGSNSENAIRIIAPAANPNHTGKNHTNCFTNKNAGTAINGCGRLEKILHSPAFRRFIPRGTITALIANHSGML